MRGRRRCLQRRMRCIPWEDSIPGGGAAEWEGRSMQWWGSVTRWVRNGDAFGDGWASPREQVRLGGTPKASDAFGPSPSPLSPYYIPNAQAETRTRLWMHSEAQTKWQPTSLSPRVEHILCETFVHLFHGTDTAHPLDLHGWNRAGTEILIGSGNERNVSWAGLRNEFRCLWQRVSPSIRHTHTRTWGGGAYLSMPIFSWRRSGKEP